jgi:hypothetical protein
MALDPEKQARFAQVNASLLDAVTGRKPLPAWERAALSAELQQLYQADTAPQPVVDDRTAARVARADKLSKALSERRWEPGDRRILAERLTETLQSMPDDGVWTPPINTTAHADPSQLPFAMLPGGLAEKLRDNSLPAEAQELAMADLDAALSGIGAASGAGGEAPQ